MYVTGRSVNKQTLPENISNELLISAQSVGSLMSYHVTCHTTKSVQTGSAVHVAVKIHVVAALVGVDGFDTVALHH